MGVAGARLLLSLYVLAVLWPALLLYHIVDRAKGIDSIAAGLAGTVGDRGLLLVLVAWAFSGLLEGLAGFGLPSRSFLRCWLLWAFHPSRLSPR